MIQPHAGRLHIFMVERISMPGKWMNHMPLFKGGVQSGRFDEQQVLF